MPFGGRWVLPREWATGMFFGALVSLWCPFFFGLGLIFLLLGESEIELICPSTEYTFAEEGVVKHLTFRVDDVAGILDHLRAHGVELIHQHPPSWKSSAVASPSSGGLTARSWSCSPRPRQARMQETITKRPSCTEAGVGWRDIIADVHGRPVGPRRMHVEADPQGVVVRAEGEEAVPYAEGFRSEVACAAWSVAKAVARAVGCSGVRLVNSMPLS